MSDPTSDVSLQLNHASVMTAALDDAVAFYVDLLGLTLRVIEDDPIRQGRQRAMLTDEAGRDILEIIEMRELAHPSVPGRGSIHHLGFELTPDAYTALRSRLDAAGHAYQETKERLFVRDVDGLVLEIEHDG